MLYLTPFPCMPSMLTAPSVPRPVEQAQGTTMGVATKGWTEEDICLMMRYGPSRH